MESAYFLCLCMVLPLQQVVKAVTKTVDNEPCDEKTIVSDGFLVEPGGTCKIKGGTVSKLATGECQFIAKTNEDLKIAKTWNAQNTLHYLQCAIEVVKQLYTINLDPYYQQDKVCDKNCFDTTKKQTAACKKVVWTHDPVKNKAACNDLCYNTTDQKMDVCKTMFKVDLDKDKETQKEKCTTLCHDTPEKKMEVCKSMFGKLPTDKPENKKKCKTLCYENDEKTMEICEVIPTVNKMKICNDLSRENKMDVCKNVVWGKIKQENDEACNELCYNSTTKHMEVCKSLINQDNCATMYLSKSQTCLADKEKKATPDKIKEAEVRKSKIADSIPKLICYHIYPNATEECKECRDCGGKVTKAPGETNSTKCDEKACKDICKKCNHGIQLNWTWMLFCITTLVVSYIA